MDGAAHTLQQQEIHRSLEYRPIWRWAFYLLLASAPLLALIGWINAFALIRQDRFELAMAFSVFGLLVPSCHAWIAWFWLRPFAFTRVRITNRGLTLKRFGEATEIPFFRVRSLKFSFLPYLGGWFTLEMHDGREYRFTVGLERSDYLLDALAIAQPTLMPTAELARFRRICIVTDHAFARLQTALADWSSLLIMEFGLPGVLTILAFLTLGGGGVTDAFVVFAGIALMNGIIGLLIWIPKEIIEIRRKDLELQENPLNPLRDMRREKREKIFSRCIHVAAITTLVIWICTA